MSLTPNEIAQIDADYAQALADDIERLEELMRDVVYDRVNGVETACAEGCVVEADGRCFHGHQSPLRVLGMI